MKKILITRKLIKESEEKASKTFKSIFNSNETPLAAEARGEE